MTRKFRLDLLLSFLVVGSLLFTLGCTEDELVIPPPTAGFTYSIDSETGGIVTFNNTSDDAETFQWDFGDGTFSTLSNPRKMYMESGTYDVSLVATNAGGSDEDKQTITIELKTIITDEDPPVITLLGESSIELEIGDEFTDPGATANDEVDGDVSANIVVTGEVNPLQPGEYVLAYNVTDAAGNVAEEVTRTVKVNYDQGVLVNGDFEDGTAGWIGNGLEVREEGGNSFTFTNVTTAGNPFDVNISQVLPIRAGSKYRLSFNAVTDQADGRTMLAGIGLNEDPWTNVTQEFELTNEVQRFSAEFTANFDSDNSRVIFDMGADVGVVVLDNVSLELLSQSITALPLDFENVELQTTVFNGAAFSVVTDPSNSGNSVGKITNSGAAFEGMFFTLSTPVNFNQGKIITMRFNTPTAGVPVLMKFESGSADPVEVVAEAAASGWQELTFDFGDASDTYSQLTLFVDGPGTTAGDFYIDDIAQSDGGGSGGGSGCEGPAVAAVDFPVTFESCESFISTFFGEGSLTTELAPNPSKTGINTSDNSLKVVKSAGTNRWAGFQNAFAENFNTNQTLKLKVYSSKADVVMRFELNSEPQAPGSGNPPPQFRTVAQANTWVELEVVFTDIPGSNTGLNQLVIKPDNPDGTDGTLTSSTETYYFDDIRWEGSDGPGGTGEAFFIDEFNSENAVEKWARLANAENNPNATLAYSADGGVGGSGAILLTLNDPAGGAYIFRYTNATVDYEGNANIRVSYDAKVVTPVTGSALHMQTQVPNPGGGVITTNTFDTQNAINNTTFTTITQDIDAIDPAGTLFILDLNFATGGGGAGAVLIDNVRIEKR